MPEPITASCAMCRIQSIPALVEASVNAQEHVDARQLLISYGAEAWDADQLRTSIQPIAAWQAEHHVRVICY